MTLFFLILLTVSLVILAWQNLKPKRKPIIKPSLPGIKIIGSADINKSMMLKQATVLPVKPEKPLTTALAEPVPTTPLLVNTQTQTTKPIEPTHLEPPANLPI